MSAAAPRASAKLFDAGASIFANPVAQWALIILGSWLALRWLVPDIYGGSKKAVKTAFGDLAAGVSSAVDATQNNISTIIGQPSSNAPNRSITDEIKGFFVPGDRALSDLID